LEGDPLDLCFDGETFTAFRSERVPTRHTHGTGCTFASAIAAGLARGLNVPEAVAQAKDYVTGAIREGLAIGGGHGPVHHFHHLYRLAGGRWA
jgi:hydroxymethylpyrimidine/phosphomethylpyrimidine kinase